MLKISSRHSARCPSHTIDLPVEDLGLGRHGEHEIRQPEWSTFASYSRSRTSSNIVTMSRNPERAMYGMVIKPNSVIGWTLHGSDRLHPGNVCMLNNCIRFGRLM